MAVAFATLSFASAHADYTDSASVTALEARVADLEKRLADAEVRLNQAKIPAAVLASCADSVASLPKAPEGFKCKTSAGAIFTRVAQNQFGEAWKGPDGTVWGATINGSFKEDEAVDQCTNSSGSLPTQESNFERGEANGIREVLPGLKGQIFWSSTQGPGGDDYSFADYNGGDEPIDFAIPNSTLSVRCVAR